MKRIVLLLSFLVLSVLSITLPGQIPVQQGIIASSNAVSYTAEYQSVLDRATTLGYTLPSIAQRTKQNQLIIDLKAAGIWSLIDVLYVFATDGSSDFATLNWKSPTTFQLTKVNSPTFTTNQGFAGNGTTSYLNTNWTPSTNGVNVTLNNASYSEGVTTDVANLNQEDFGGIGASSANSLRFNPRTGANQTAGRLHTTGGGPVAGPGNTNSVGFYQFRRVGAGAFEVFKNGANLGSTTSSSNGLTTVPIFICALNNNNGGPFQFSTRRISVWIAAASLNTLESSLYTAWNNYFTSL